MKNQSIVAVSIMTVMSRWFILWTCWDTMSITIAFTSTGSKHKLTPFIVSSTLQKQQQQQKNQRHPNVSLQMIFEKLFEEEGPLGKGITVGKVQVALAIQDRSSPSSIFTSLVQSTQDVDDSNEALSQMTHEVSLTLLRKSDQWIGACSDSKWFSENDGGKAENTFNEWVNREALKFEKVYTPDSRGDDKSSSSLGASSTLAVVSIIVEIQGDTTEFKGAGKNIAETKAVLSSLASSVLVDEGYCLNAVEILWTPSEKDEILTKKDIMIDFPEIIDF